MKTAPPEASKSRSYMKYDALKSVQVCSLHLHDYLNQKTYSRMDEVVNLGSPYGDISKVHFSAVVK